MSGKTARRDRRRRAEEFVLWVIHGEDERAKTLEIVHAFGRRYA